MELVLLDGLFSEPDKLFFGLSLILWKGHPLANDFAARLVVFLHVRGSFYFLGGNLLRAPVLLQLWGLAASCLSGSRPFPARLFIGLGNG
jgi:hypothetical protein